MNRRPVVAALLLLALLGGLAGVYRAQLPADSTRRPPVLRNPHPVGAIAELPPDSTAPPPAPAQLHFPLDRYLGLTGTYGELRENHFHFGLDLRVAGWGAPVYAAADGFVSRARVWFNGYGKALYIRHPDGTSTCYAHLERFGPGIDERVVQVQREKRQFIQDLFFGAQELRVKKGQVVGYVGSTGGSTGPHLHFEVRDGWERPLNPMPWLRTHISDQIAPFISRLALMPLDASARVEGRFERWIHYPQPQGQSYRVAQEVRVWGPVGLEYTAYDRQNGAPNYNGIYAADLYLDDTLIHRFQADRYTFDDSRYVLQHKDHCYYRQTGGYLSKAYTDDGNLAPLYPAQRNRGIVHLRDDRPHRLRLDIRDWHGNRCFAHLTVRRAAPPPAQPAARTGRPPTFRLVRQTLILESDWPDTGVRIDYADGTSQEIAPAYTYKGRATTLLPIRAGKVPRRALFPDGQELKLPIAAVGLPGSGQSVEGAGGLRAWIGPGVLFDTTALVAQAQSPVRFPSACSPLCSLGEIGIGVMKPLGLRVAPDRNTDRYPARQRQLIEIKPDGSFNRFSVDGQGATLAKRLGTYCLLGDSEPPQLRPTNFQADRPASRRLRFLAFRAWDDIAEIDPWQVSATVNGQWALAEYYDFPQLLHVPLHAIAGDGPHELSIRLVDQAGNARTFRYTLRLLP